MHLMRYKSKALDKFKEFKNECRSNIERVLRLFDHIKEVTT